MALGGHRITVSGYPGRMTFATAQVLRAISRLHKAKWYAFQLMDQLEDFNLGTVNKIVYRLGAYGIIERADDDEYRKNYKLTVAGYKLLQDEQLKEYMATLRGSQAQKRTVAAGQELPLSWSLLEVLSALENATEPRSCWQLATEQPFSVGIALRVTRQLEAEGLVDVVLAPNDSGRSTRYISLSSSGKTYLATLRTRFRQLGF